MSNLRNPVDATEKRTLVEEGTTFKGTLTSTCPIFVKGGVEGDIQAPSLTVATTGIVSGKVKAGELKSEGSLAGEFDVDKVQLSGSVKDNTVIRARSLEVKLSSAGGKMQVVFGETELEIGDMPTLSKSPGDKAADGRPGNEKGNEAKGDGKDGKTENGKSVPPPPES